MPVRLAAAHSALFLLRNLKQMEQRAELLNNLVSDFCHGKSCHRRTLFIDICKVTMDLYSKAFFKENLFMYLLSLHLDPVPNIRYRLCSVLPDLKRLIKLPSDRTLLQHLDACVRKLLIGERDRDVANAIKVAVEEMDRIPIQMESLTRRILMEEDIDDQRKEAEEKKLIEIEEREIKKEEEAAKAKAEKKGHKENASKIPAPKKGKSAIKQDRESAGVKRTPSTPVTNTNTTFSVKVSVSPTNEGESRIPLSNACKRLSGGLAGGLARNKSVSLTSINESESKIPLANTSKRLARTKSDSSTSKTNTKSLDKPSRSGASGVPTPTSAGARKSVIKIAENRRGSFSSSPTTEKGTAVRKNSNGSLPSKLKKTK